MRHYKELWTILALAFAFFFILSYFDGIAIGDSFELRSAGFVRALTDAPRKTAAADTTVLAAASDAPEAKATFAPAPTDTTAQTILFIGDSMLDGLSPRMVDYCLQNGHKLISFRWYSSSTSKWGSPSSSLLSDLIAKHKPSYVFICLGANELFINNVDTKCGPAVDNILADIGSTPYIWIGPPNWKPDTGINDLIARKTRPGTFFLSNGMSFERRKDGAHPTDPSAAMWLDSVMRWMPAHAAQPIRMDSPRKPLPAKAPGQISIRIRQPNE
ncbi:MAG: hypothetical protein K2M06_07315 [Muribaculaceae bacterium]|nr:hypothetical protein [Muribaculaceae bacterium]